MTQMTASAAVPAGFSACMPAVVVKAQATSDEFALSSRLPSLDGWRAVSILAVLGSHTKDVAGFPMERWDWFNHAFDGHLAVRFFFVLSGFLITWLMILEEKSDGTVNLKNFYLRRALRILPVYLVFLAVVAVLQWLTPFQQGTLGWLGNLTFTTNYLHVTHASDHLWSLAVEEQFYILWPMAFVFFRPQASLRQCLVICGVLFSIAFLSRLVLGHAGDDARLLQRLVHQWSFFNNADSLAVGCLAAILLARPPAAFLHFIRNSITPALVCGVALIVLPIGLHYVQALPGLPSLLQSFAWTVEVCCGRSLQSVGFAIVMVQSILRADWGFYKMLNHGVLAQFGVLSYSIYIWQQIFCTHPAAFGLPDVWWMSYPFWIVPVLVVACVSYYGLERPLLRLRRRFR